MNDLTYEADMLKIGIETADALYLDGGVIGTESAMTTLIDVTMRYYYNIKNALTDGDFRRNELRFFTERNSSSMRQFLNNKLARMSIEVDIPEYMVGTYGSASRALLEIIRNRDMSDVMKQMSNLMDGIVPNTPPSKDFIDKMKVYTQDQLIPFTRDTIVKRLQSEFSGSAAIVSLGSKGKRALASEVIGTHSDFVEIYNELLKIDDIYRDVINLQKIAMPAVDKSTRAMITRVHAARGTADQLTEDVKKTIYVCLRRYAEMIDGYGVLLQLLQTVEHNFVLCTSTLMETNK